MVDLRPVFSLIGYLVAALGLAMWIPAFIAWWTGTIEADTFLVCGFVTAVIGGILAISSPARTAALNIQQIFLLTTLSWLVLPFFGALPFWFGEPHASFTDSFFEAMSGLTTTGATVMTGLDALPHATNIWRAMLQWFGGVGIVVVAMAFLPALRIGGMQIFRSEGFDTMGKLLPRAAEISVSLSLVYILLTVACFISYEITGLDSYESFFHALTTVSTGGFSNHDASFGELKGVPEYVASVFMILASLPFIRFVQLLSGSAGPLLGDPQVRGFIKFTALVILSMTLYLTLGGQLDAESAFRESLFNVVSILTGTGYASVDYQTWGPIAVVVFFLIGLVGGCAGSTCCSIKIFRYQLLIAAVRAQIRTIHSPSGVFEPRYDGRPVTAEVYSSVMAFFVLFLALLMVFSIALGLMGYDLVTAISGAATALANVGPGLGPIIGPAGNFAPLIDEAKWLLIIAMLLGRLELMAVLVLFTSHFWRQ